MKDHAILGRWDYQHGAGNYARVLTENGLCAMLDGEKVVWTKPFTVESPTRVLVEGAGANEIKTDGTLNIKGRYTGKKRADEPKAGNNK